MYLSIPVIVLLGSEQRGLNEIGIVYSIWQNVFLEQQASLLHYNCVFLRFGCLFHQIN